MPEQILYINTRGAGARVVLLATVLVTVAFGWFAVRWQLGNMLGEITTPTDPDAEALSLMAKSLSPYDPLTSWLLASARYNPSDPESIKQYAEALEEVVRRSPYDNRWWIELGRAYEQAGQAERAEKAFAKAVELAPNYTYPHWQRGNFLLRAGRGEEAFAELKLSAKLSSIYREQVFSVAWDYYDRDASKLDALAGSDPEMLAGLTKFYASREKADEALISWSRLSPDERERNRAVGALVARALFEKRYFRVAAEFARDLGLEPEATVGGIVNGGFETQLSERPENLFGWYLIKKDKVEIRQDQIVKKSGQKSLRMNFKGFSGGELANLFQYFAVDAGASYRLRFFIKTEDLRSQSPVTVDVAGINAVDLRKSEVVPDTLATASFPNGTSDWQEVVLEFNTLEGVQGLQVRFNRISCGEGCFIYGSLWVDDMKLERVR